MKRLFLVSSIDPLLLILVAWSVGLRILYAATVAPPVIAPDTYGYSILGNRMLAGSVPLINDARSPLYPLFLALGMVVSGHWQADVASPGFVQGSQFIAAIQSALALAALVLFYRLLVAWGFTRYLAFGISLATASNIMVFAWERILISESLITTWLILIMWGVWLVLKRQSFLRFLFLLMLFILGFLTKPIYAGLPFVLTLVLLWYRHNKPHALTLTTVLFLFSLMPIYTLTSNTIRYDYTGISHVMDINILGKILQFGLPAEASKGHTKLYDAFVSYQQNLRDPNPYVFLNYYDPGLLVNEGKQEAINELKPFVTHILIANAPKYIGLSLLDLPKTLITPHAFLNAPTYLSFNGLWRIFWGAAIAVQYLTFLSLPLFAVALCRLRDKPTPQTAFGIALGAIVLYHMLTTVLLAYEDYGRLMAPTTPLLYAFCVWGLIMTRDSIRKTTTSKKS